MRTLVFDVGGSLLRAGVWDSDTAALVRRAELPSPGLRQGSSDPVSELVDALRRLGESAIGEEGPPDSIGLAFPGPVGPRGRVSAAPTLWGERTDEPIDLGELVSRALWETPTHVVNDLTAAGFRYAEPGEDFCIITVSSGIGNKVFLDGEPVLGKQHRGGEIGHWRVDQSSDAPLCECGGRGHLGAMASGRSVAHHVSVTRSLAPDLFAMSPLSGALASSGVTASSGIPASGGELNRQLAEAFRGGDAFASAVVKASALPLGIALANLHVSIGLERFIVVGGWARALGSGYLRLLEESAAANCWGAPEAWSGRIEAGASDDDSGLIGMGRMLARSTP